MSVTLHEEIVAILKASHRSMTSSEIAEQVNRRKLYHRGDGQKVPPSQVRARAHNYPILFLLEGRQIKLRK